MGDPNGLYAHDARVISKLQLTIDGTPVEELGHFITAPGSATFVGQVRGVAESDRVLVVRERTLTAVMLERISITNYASEARTCVVRLSTESDFAHIFDVKAQRLQGTTQRSVGARLTARDVGSNSSGMHGADDEVTQYGAFVAHSFYDDRELEAFASPPPIREPNGRLRWDVNLVPRAAFTIVCTFLLEGAAPFSSNEHLPEGSTTSDPNSAQSRLKAFTTTCTCDDERLENAVRTALQDIAALRIVDARFPDVVGIAAGAPWYMTLFGRDSLLTAWMMLPFAPELTRGVLLLLAAQQGTKYDERTEEQPGRILHEVRQGGAPGGWPEVYFGTIDATPLFVTLAGEAWKWGALSIRDLEKLVPNLDRAMSWIAVDGDFDDDGFVEYERETKFGLANQGWKDSWDGITHADGRVAEAPIALCEVQGYVYSAYLARATIADALGDVLQATRMRTDAHSLADRFNEAFWLSPEHRYMLGLDARKQVVDSMASNVGHCLWSGIIPDERAAFIEQQMMSEAMWSGWGIRTLAQTMPAYNPLSYHNGSVWPHDTAIIAAGLARYGRHDAVATIVNGLLDVARCCGGRLPELFAGIDRSVVGTPVSYPTSCSPQAWSSASPLLLVRAVLGLDVDIETNTLRIDPHLPEFLGNFRIDGICFGGQSWSIEASGTSGTITQM